MDENKKVFFIINKYSGTEYQDSVEGRIIAACEKLNLDCTIEFTRDRGHAIELAQGAAGAKFKRVFAVGGDGTVNEVAQGLLRTDVVMGVIPKGSGNGLARHLGIPLKLSAALSLLQSNRVIRMDTLSINDRLSVNVSGIGFDGHIAGLFGQNGKRGLAGYTKLVLKEFMKYKELDASVTVDNEVLQLKSFIIALANSSQFGNNATIAPQASVMDEWIDVCFIRKVPISQSVGFAAKMFSGNLDKSAFVKIRRGKNLEIDFTSMVSYHIDGEPQEPASHFKVKIQPASLSMIIPSPTGKRPI